MISVTSLIVAGVGPTQAKIMAAPLLAACDQFDIDTPAREGAFVGQCMVETGRFVTLEESLYYRDADRIARIYPLEVPNVGAAQSLVRNPQALANRVYANKNGNGDEASGDGWRYRGRGLIQITGRHNYSDASVELGIDYLNDPDLVAQAEGACLTAAWFFSTRKLHLLADSWAIDAITRQVNGPAMRDSSLRRQFSEQCRDAFA